MKNSLLMAGFALFIMITGACWEGATPGDGKQKTGVQKPTTSTSTPTSTPKTDSGTPAPAAPAPKITKFKADALSVKKGGSVKLSWQVSNSTDATKIVLEPGFGTVSPSETRWMSPKENTVYVLNVFASAEAASPAATSSVSITVRTAQMGVVSRSPDGTVDEGGAVETPAPETPPTLPDAGGDTPASDPCEGAPAHANVLKDHLQLSLASNRIYAGEKTELTWGFPFISPRTRAQVASSGRVLSADAVGTLEVNPVANETYYLSVEHCGVAVSKTVSLTVDAWKRKNIGQVSVVYSAQAGRPIWAGKTDGSLLKSTNGGAQWTSVSPGSRIGWAFNDGRQWIDDTALTAILEPTSGCTDALFIGSAKGYFYRSKDGGVSFLGPRGTPGFVTSFATNRQDPEVNPAAVRFIIQDPQNARRIYIGNAYGLSRLNDCDANAVSNVAADVLGGTDVAHAAVVAGKLYVANAAGVYASGNGDQWEKISEFGEGVQALSSDGISLHAVTSRAHWVYNGTTWTQESMPEGSQAGAFLKDRQFYLAQHQVSVKKGDTLSSIPLADEEVKSISLISELAGTNALWAVTHKGNIYTLWAPVYFELVYHAGPIFQVSLTPRE